MKIKKGRHYGSPFPFPHCLRRHKVNIGKTTENNEDRLLYYDTKWLSFDDTIKYNIGKEDQADVNKLFGFSYGYHHNNSDRIGFRYDLTTSKVQLVLYSYSDGNRLPTMIIDSVDVNEQFAISLLVQLTATERTITCKLVHINDNEEEKQEKTFKINIADTTSMKKKIKYSLGLYFGGNQVAPRTINIHEYSKDKNGKIIDKI